MSMSSGKAPVAQPLPYKVAAEHWFARIRSLPLPVLLSSGTSTHNAARFDIITADPEIILRAGSESTLVTLCRSGETRLEHDSPFEVLARYCPLQPDLKTDGLELPFTGGAIGYFGYELLHAANHIEWADKSAIGLPQMLIGIYHWAIIIDHAKQQSWLVTRDFSLQRQHELMELLETKTGLTAVDSGFRLTTPFKSNYSLPQYLQRFRKIIDYIHAGDCYQVNLAQCFTASCTGDSWTAFRRLQERANAPFAAYMQDGEQAVLSFSPERFIRVTQLEVMTQPIKGTRPRSADPEQDLANRIDLETSMKDRAENLMIVDLLRNDLGRVCQFGSVSVENLFETQSFTNVHHLVSTVKGRLEKPDDVFRLLAASFPGGSITGTPKLRAMEIISELETMPRSVYCGAIAWIDFNGNMDSNICIRSLVKDNDQIHCWGGGAIVADSNGESEYQETLDKISMLIHNL
jgi:para-aminobenzoate synthetase component 1